MKNLILFLTKKGIYLLTAICLSFLQGCMFYYKAQTVKRATAREIGKYALEDKYFILHRDISAWHLSGIEVNIESLTGYLSDVPAERWKYDITGSTKAAHRYKAINKSVVLDQVHLYLKDSVVPSIDSSGHIKVALADFKGIEVYQKDKDRTNLSWGIPLFLTVALIASIIIGGLTMDAGAGLP